MSMRNGVEGSVYVCLQRKVSCAAINGLDIIDLKKSGSLSYFELVHFN